MDEKRIAKIMERNQRIIDDSSIYRIKTCNSIMRLLDLEIENIDDIFPNYTFFIEDLVKLHKILFDYQEKTNYNRIVRTELKQKGLKINELHLSVDRDYDDDCRIIRMRGYIGEGEGIDFMLEYPTQYSVYYIMEDELPTFKLTTVNRHGEAIHKKIGFTENLYEEFSKITELFIKYWEMCKRIK